MEHLFTVEEHAQIKASAKVKAAEILEQRYIEQALAQCEQSPTMPSDWVLFPPSDEGKTALVLSEPELAKVVDPHDDFAEVSIYGILLRVNRTGTAVEIFLNGKWEDRSIRKLKGAVPYISLPNKLCPGSIAKDGQVSYRVTHLVIQAFGEMPDYVKDVLFTRKGPTILFGLRLCNQINKVKHDCNFENLEWVSEAVFKRAVRVKMKNKSIPEL